MGDELNISLIVKLPRNANLSISFLTLLRSCEAHLRGNEEQYIVVYTGPLAVGAFARQN